MTKSDSKPSEELPEPGNHPTDSTGPPKQSIRLEDIEQIWPTRSKEEMEAPCGKTSNPEGLSAKTGMLLQLLALTITGARSEVEVRVCIRDARAAGATHTETVETIALAGLFGDPFVSAKVAGWAFEMRDELEEI